MQLVIDGRRLTKNRTGVGRCLESLIADWSETGMPIDETLLVLPGHPGERTVRAFAGLRTVVTGKDRPGIVWENVALGRCLRPDDVLFAPASLVPWNWRGRAVLMIYDTLLWTAAETFPWHVHGRFRARYRNSARRASRVIVPSRSTARDVARFHGISESLIRVIPLAPEPGFRPVEPEGFICKDARLALGLGDRPYFLFVGKRSARRNISLILDAFARHRLSFPGHRLVLVGPDDRGRVPSVDAGVICGGHVEERVLHGLYAGALALLYLSNYEGFGLPIVEAMACGCPVVTLRNSALVETGGEAALYLDALEPEALALVMNALATDDALRSRLAARGLEQAASFDRARFASAVKEEIRSVAAS